MTEFTIIAIMGILLIIGGVTLAATPLITFISAGYFIVILFFVMGIAGIVQGIRSKRYDKKFFFAILSLVLGLVGLLVPGAVAMNNTVLLYLAAGWFFVHGILTILEAIESRKEGATTGEVVLGVILGLLEILVAVYSAMHPSVMAVSIGILIGFYFVESGVNVIVTGSKLCEGANSVTILFTALGVVTILGGIVMLATPLLNFLSAGYCIIMLFFFHGVLGIVDAVAEKRYDKEFVFAIISLILGIIGFMVPGVAAMNNSILLYMAAAFFFIHGILTIVKAFKNKKEGAETKVVVIGIVIGVLELLMGAYSVAHPAVLAIGIGVLISFYFIVSGADMIFMGSELSKAVAVARALAAAKARR